MIPVHVLTPYFRFNIILPSTARTVEKNNEGKVVAVLLLPEHHAMKAYWGSGGIAPLILLPWH
jgi:hypothetical protein